MIEEKHEKWIRKKFPIFYTIKPNLEQQFTSSELDSLHNDLVVNRQQLLSKKNQKTLKKLKKLANQSQKLYRSNKELYNLLSKVNSQEINQITLGHKKIQCLKPLEKKSFLKLSEIDFAFNNIEKILPLTTSQLPSLAYFNITQNSINTLKGLEKCDWPRLKILNLSHNQITSIEPLSNGLFISLQKLDISQNSITKIQSFHKSSSWELKLLNFKNNKLSSLKKAQRFCFTRISELILNGNPLTNSVDIEKLQMTTLKNKRVSQEYQGEKRASQQKGDEFISQTINKFKKEDLLYDFFEEKMSKNPLKCSKHAQYAVVEAYHQPNVKIPITEIDVRPEKTNQKFQAQRQ